MDEDLLDHRTTLLKTQGSSSKKDINPFYLAGFFFYLFLIIFVVLIFIFVFMALKKGFSGIA
jgi:hypothetical protein